MRPIQAWWYRLMAAGGLAFGFIGERRPFGQDMLAHPLVVYFALAAIGLLILRAVLARPGRPGAYSGGHISRQQLGQHASRWRRNDTNNVSRIEVSRRG